ncbi:MAG: S-layer homology domain-containing protein [Oscillospiraceae bacterium]|nr:S-layer homology domain-containing protein [Oscillospiraceae bacterium]
MKKAIAAAITLLMLVCAATASASQGGTSKDPLVTLSHFNSSFAQPIRSEVADRFGAAALSAQTRLDKMFKDSARYAFAGSYTYLALSQDDSVALTAGASFILTSGSAELTVINGQVVNVSTGEEAASGEILSLSGRYFCTEDTFAIVTMGAASEGFVDGYYIIAADLVASGTHRVFKDVASDAWYYAAVDFVYRNGLFAGTSDDAFSPEVPMTRAMFVTVLHRLAGKPAAQGNAQGETVADATGSGEHVIQTFDDVPAGEWYTDAVIWANANGIVTGYDDGLFRPGTPLSREQMATIILRYAAHSGADVQSPEGALDDFPDMGAVSLFALDAMRWAVSEGVINGSGGRLLPQGTATRAQVAQVMRNYIG